MPRRTRRSKRRTDGGLTFLQRMELRDLLCGIPLRLGRPSAFASEEERDRHLEALRAERRRARARAEMDKLPARRRQREH